MPACLEVTVVSEDSVGRIGLDLGVNYGAFNNELKGIAGNATSMVGGAFKKLGGIIAAAFAVGKLVEFGKQSVELASNLSEVQNVVDVTFGAMAEDINAWSKIALQQFGLSELSAKKYSSTMGAMMKSSGLAGVQMEGMSKKLTELSADMASFYNLSTDMAFEKIRSGISGETEPLKQLGINMSAANMEAYALSQGIKKSYDSMTQAEQTLLRYNYLLSVSKDAQGDFARTSGSWANQVRLLGEQFKIFQGTLGAGFINILTPVIQGLNTLIQKLQVAAQYFKAFTELIFGAQQTTSATVAAQEDMSNSTGGVGKSVKKAGKDIKGSLSSFDQLNTLSQNTADSMADIADTAGAVGDVDLGMTNATNTVDLGIDAGALDPFKAKLAEMLDIVKTVGQGIKDTLGPSFQQAFNAISPVLQSWKTTLGNVFADIGTLWAPLKDWFTTNLVPAWQTAITVAGDVLAGLLDTGKRVFQGIWDAAFPVLQWFVTDGLSFITDFANKALDLFDNLFRNVKRVFDMLWDEGVKPGLDLASSMIIDVLGQLKGFWDTWGGQIINNFKTMFDKIADTLKLWWDTVLKPIWDTILSTIKWLWDNHLKGLIDAVLEFIGKLVTGAQDIYNKFINPSVNAFVKIFGPAIRNAFQTVIDILGTVIGVVADVVKGIFKILSGIVDFIVGVFTGDWERAWLGVKEIFTGIFDAIVGVFKGAINLIIDGVNGMIRNLNRIKVPEVNIPGLGKVGGWGVNIPLIPKLANGGLVSAPTLAMVGDNRNAAADPEVISPLSKLQDMLGGSNQAVIDVLMMILDAIKNNNQQFVMRLGRTEFGRLTAECINEAQRQAGKPLLIV